MQCAFARNFPEERSYMFSLPDNAPSANDLPSSKNYLLILLKSFQKLIEYSCFFKDKWPLVDSGYYFK